MIKYIKANHTANVLDFEVGSVGSKVGRYVDSIIAVDSLPNNIQSFLVWMVEHACTRVNVSGNTKDYVFDNGKYAGYQDIPSDLEPDEWTWVSMELDGNTLICTGSAAATAKYVPISIQKKLPWATKVEYVSDYELPTIELSGAVNDISLDSINESKFAKLVTKIITAAMLHETKMDVDYYELFD